MHGQKWAVLHTLLWSSKGSEHLSVDSIAIVMMSVLYNLMQSGEPAGTRLHQVRAEAGHCSWSVKMPYGTSTCWPLHKGYHMSGVASSIATGLQITPQTACAYLLAVGSMSSSSRARNDKAMTPTSA